MASGYRCAYYIYLLKLLLQNGRDEEPIQRNCCDEVGYQVSKSLISLLTMPSCVNIVMLFAAVPLIERLGRRALMIWCGPIAIVALLVMGGVLKTDGSAVGPVLIAFA